MHTRTSISRQTFLQIFVPVLTVLVTAPAHSQNNEVSDDLRKAAKCMLTVLKGAPGVSDPTLSYTTKNGQIFPVLAYRADEKSRWTRPTEFSGTQNTDGSILFMAILPGMSNREAGLPDFHVTEAIEKEWRTQCHVNAFFVMA